MNIKQVTRLLNDEGIPTILKSNSIEQDRDQGESYYKLQLETNKWELLFVQRENRSSGGEKVLKTFDDESSASKYYYLSTLSSFYFRKHIQPFELKNEDINIGWTEFTFDNLEEALLRLNFDDKYYSLRGGLKRHSAFLEKVSEKESKVKFIGDKYDVVFETTLLDNWNAYYVLYKYAYYLYLLDNHCNYLIERKEINERFTDEEYSVFLS